MKKYIYGSALLFIIASIYSVGYFHPDEHFQILEFALYKLNGTNPNNLAWEFAATIRPGLQPFIAYSVLKVGGALGITNPFVIAFILRLLSAILSFGTILYLYKALLRNDKLQVLQHPKFNNAYILLAFLSWYVVFLGVRFSSETWGMALFGLGIATWLRHKPYWLVGLLMGLSFVCRFQMVFMIAGFGIYLLCILKQWKVIVPLVLGFCMALAIGTLADYWLYGKWVFTAYNYFFENIIAGKAANFGTYPWYFYIVRNIGFGLPPFSIFIIVSVFAFFYFYPKHWLTWVLVPFLLVHFIVGHKEVRFIFPILLYLPYILVAVVNTLRTTHKYHNIYSVLYKIKNWAVPTYITLQIIMLLFTSFTAINYTVPTQQYIYNNCTTNDKVYCLTKSPYVEGGNVAAFYQKQNVLIQTIANLNEYDANMQTNANLYVIAPSSNQLLSNKQYTLCYNSLPQWVVANFNYNNWIQRSNTWCVYKLVK